MQITQHTSSSQSFQTRESKRPALSISAPEENVPGGQESHVSNGVRMNPLRQTHDDTLVAAMALVRLLAGHGTHRSFAPAELLR